MTQGRSYSLFAKAGLVALALSIGGALAFVGPVGSPAFAASEPSGGGGGSSGGGSSGSSNGNDHNCATGKVWDKNQKKCVPKQSSLSRDRKLYDQGRALALAGKYDDALGVFARIKKQKDAKVLTMIGYSKRKLGDVDAGMALYQQALALEPNNLYTLEYLGEGYLQTGNIDQAELQLAKLESLCGKKCEQYQDLAKAIAGAPGSTWNAAD